MRENVDYGICSPAMGYVFESIFLCRFICRFEDVFCRLLSVLVGLSVCERRFSMFLKPEKPLFSTFLKTSVRLTGLVGFCSNL